MQTETATATQTERETEKQQAKANKQKARDGFASADAQYIARRIVGNLWGIWWATMLIGVVVAIANLH